MACRMCNLTICKTTANFNHLWPLCYWPFGWGILGSHACDLRPHRWTVAGVSISNWKIALIENTTLYHRYNIQLYCAPHCRFTRNSTAIVYIRQHLPCTNKVWLHEKRSVHRDMNILNATKSRNPDPSHYNDVIMSVIVSNHQPHNGLLNLLFRRRSKKTPKLRGTGLCEGNSPVTGDVPSQRASNAENVSIWWRHHELWFENVGVTVLKLWNQPWCAQHEGVFDKSRSVHQYSRVIGRVAVNCLVAWWRHQMKKIIFHVTSPLWGESTSHRWIPLAKASDPERWCFLWSAL